ncbi:MAG: AbrB/MazE/SpoVT family DNA-binding domain-containing protein [Chloroflexi bacterium]|nr:AbrB/MazE/SpoVT family DNA-binding domain-containing protein [Chloroflexota bacterium]
MKRKVGPKGQVVVEKETRDRLGIEPGSIAVQRAVDDHVETHFLPPVRLHSRSLRGILKPPRGVTLRQEDWATVRDGAKTQLIATGIRRWRLPYRRRQTRPWTGIGFPTEALYVEALLEASGP